MSTATEWNWLDIIHDELRVGPWRSRPALLDSPWEGPVIGPEGLMELLASGVRAPYLKVLRDGYGIPVSEFSTVRNVMGTSGIYMTDPAVVAALLEQGDTVLLPQLDQWHAPTAAVTQALAQCFGRKVEAFLFATKAGKQGLDIHRDDADVLVVQCGGVKNWRVYGGPEDAYWGPGPVAEPGPPVFQSELQAGRMLYLPRGAAHAATGAAGLSVHLSFRCRWSSGCSSRTLLCRGGHLMTAACFRWPVISWRSCVFVWQSRPRSVC
jgi:cupin superfamily protein